MHDLVASSVSCKLHVRIFYSTHDQRMLSVTIHYGARPLDTIRRLVSPLPTWVERLVVQRKCCYSNATRYAICRLE
jgi:hypothetical protein